MLRLPFAKHNVDGCTQRVLCLSRHTIGHASKMLEILTLPFDGAVGAMASFGHDTLESYSYVEFA